MANNEHLTPPGVSELPYFVPNFTSMDEVVRYLKPYIEIDGAFIIRNSTRKDSITVSVCHQRGVKHISLQKKRKKYCLSERRLFDSIPELVDHYKSNDVPNKESVSGLRLEVPITNGFENEYENVRVSPTYINRSPGMDQVDGMRELTLNSPDFNPSTSLPRRSVGSPQEHARTRPILNGAQRTVLPGFPIQSPVPSSNKSPSPRGWVSSNEDFPSPPSTNELMALRPPPPPPSFIQALQDEIDEIRQAPLYAERPYSIARDVNMDLSQHLIDQLKSKERCECGLYMHDAQLPLDWTVHRVQDRKPNTPPLFYVSPERKSEWNLPQEVKALLSVAQKIFLQQLGGPKIP